MTLFSPPIREEVLASVGWASRVWEEQVTSGLRGRAAQFPPCCVFTQPKATSEPGLPSMLSEEGATPLKPAHKTTEATGSHCLHCAVGCLPRSMSGPLLGVGLCCKMSLPRAQNNLKKRALPVVDITPASQYDATGKQHGGFRESQASPGGFTRNMAHRLGFPRHQ